MKEGQITLRVLVAIALSGSFGSATLPLLIYSHKLVPKVQSYINNFNKLIFPIERANEIIKKTIDPCTSDAYVFIDQPGLTLDDLQYYEGYVSLRTYGLISSTIGSLPRIEKAVNFDDLVAYARRKCNADLIEVNGYEEAKTYIDTKKRVFRINLPKLPDDPELRKKALIKADKAIRMNLRKLPSPDHTIIYTTTEDRLLNKIHERKWENMNIFPDITQHPSRQQEFERNDNVKNVERPFPKKRTNLLDKSQWSVPTFLEPEVIYENELLIIGILGITTILVLAQFLKLVYALVKRLTAFRTKHKPKEE